MNKIKVPVLRYNFYKYILSYIDILVVSGIAYIVVLVF